MIEALLVVGPGGKLVSASAEGHAGRGARGTDIVCAAVTALLRTTLAVLSGKTEQTAGMPLKIDVQTAGRGSLAFRVTAFSDRDEELLKYAGAFLKEGLQALAQEYPDSVHMRVQYTDNHSGG